MKDWTIMVYMAGDNNLSIDMAYALQEIREVAKNTGEKVNLLVYYDSSLRDVPTTYYDFSDYENPFRINSLEVPDKFEPATNSRPTRPGRNRPSRNGDADANENSARAYSVLNFIDWCINKVEYKVGDTTQKGRKATNYAFIFSGHSFGFQDIGLFKDETSNYYMTLDKLGWVFQRVAQTAEEITDNKPVILGKRLGLLGFDSCVMSMLEIGYAFHEGAETMVASEGTIPNAGWTYQKLIEKIALSPKTADTKTVAAMLVDEFITSQNYYTIGGVSVDISAWDLEKTPAVVKAFKAVADNLLLCLEDETSTIYKQIKRVLLQVHWNCQTYMYDQNIDLMDFCRLLYNEAESLEKEFNGSLGDITKNLKTSCFDVMKAIDECIILSGFCGGNFQYSNGISLFFPWTLSSYLVSVKSYTDLQFFEKTETGQKWNEFLLKYLVGATYRLDRIAESNGNRVGNELDALSKPVLSYDESRIPPNIADRILPVVESRIPPNLADKIPPNLADRIPPNLADRIPPNIADRIPPNIADRIFNGMAFFMEQFTKFKNVHAPWYILGFTKDLKDKKDENV